MNIVIPIRKRSTQKVLRLSLQQQTSIISTLDEISHTGICDLISGTMTGLGILGTFLGLVSGISGFDTTTTTAITSSISGLLGGMGTAFYTSIVGVSLSLLYSYVHKIVYDRTCNDLEHFVTVFHDKNLDGAENNAENQLLSYQQQQTELMKSFASVVSDAVSSSISSAMPDSFWTSI